MDNLNIHIKRLPNSRIYITGALMVLSGIMFISTLFSNLIETQGFYKYIGGGLVILLITIGFFNFFISLKEKIWISNDKIVYKRGKEEKEIKLKEIKDIRVITAVNNGFALKNIVKRALINYLTGNYQLELSLSNNEIVHIPYAIGGGSILSPKVGFTKDCAEHAKERIKNSHIML